MGKPLAAIAGTRTSCCCSRSSGGRELPTQDDWRDATASEGWGSDSCQGAWDRSRQNWSEAERGRAAGSETTGYGWSASAWSDDPWFVGQDPWKPGAGSEDEGDDLSGGFSEDNDMTD